MKRTIAAGQQVTPVMKIFKKSSNPEKEMSLSGHLRELRNRLLVCVVLLFAAILAGLDQAPRFVALLLDMGKQYHYHFIYISPQELLLQYFFVAFVGGICVTLPVTVSQLWAFMRPGLKKGESLFFFFTMLFGMACFCAGIYFAYRIMLPFMLEFLITLSRGSGVSASISVQNYINFLMTIFIIFGLVFELPVVSVLLTQMGFLKAQWMKKGRRVVIVVIFFVAAVITPPDVVSQVMVAIPMLVLYEISILLCTLCQALKNRAQKKKKKETLE